MDLRLVFRRAFLWVAVSTVLLGALEFAWFNYIFSLHNPPLQADMLAVYGGSPDRIPAGWRAEKHGRFIYLVFSDASAVKLRGMDIRYGPPRSARLLLEPDARTTAQNARYVALLSRGHGCRSIIVITSWWHLPRALFLTHLALLGTGVHISGMAASRSLKPAWLQVQVWVEMVRLWGSLATYFSDTKHR